MQSDRFLDAINWFRTGGFLTGRYKAGKLDLEVQVEIDPTRDSMASSRMWQAKFLVAALIEKKINEHVLSTKYDPPAVQPEKHPPVTGNDPDDGGGDAGDDGRKSGGTGRKRGRPRKTKVPPQPEPGVDGGVDGTFG